MKKQILVLTVFISLLFLSCGSGGELLWLDNPTDEAISVEIDGKKYDIAPGELKRVPDGTSGKQKFKGVDGKEVEIEINGVSFINCTNATYIECAIEYSINPNSASTLPEAVEVEIAGDKYTGNFKVHTDIVIPHSNINYNVTEPLKDEISITGNSTIINKMYRIKDFLADSDMETYKN
ncbi:hypothetical protein I2486_06200 [Cellulophaga sp. E16_2]|uniref:Lipoprotein n=1 Tax=Cellulophaga algicola (strain DSM 14237 / IC166 / ACAM 630) TaxID=688270 RepID=E6X7Y2_CELAD|nr:MULTISPECIES: hypothetical protein [Cellulophaga]ADV48580.1 hypothetical protein Celal_1265 [Cellulophaga algicola DSM 14237]MBO0590996.1 hypothetical protein [Cellulophaga sp. E16_2]